MLLRFLLPVCYTLLTFHTVVISSTHARWATHEDAPVEYETYNQNITVEADGTSVEIIESQLKILNEAGREKFGIARLHYNGNIQKIEILEAKAIFEGKEYPVPKDSIETKPLASDIKGFDQLFQILISFPHVQKESQLYLKYKVTTLKQALPNYFATEFSGFQGGYFKNAHFELRSKLHFHILVNDPRKVLSIREDKEKAFQVLSVDLKTPICEATINEPQNSILEDSLSTWVSISTFNQFEDFAKNIAEHYEKIVDSSTLPPLLESIKNEAVSQSNPLDQINTVTSSLSKAIRYNGDWRSIDGRFFPRTLEAITESSIGDCKDFATCLAAILRKLGYKAHVALVMRGMAFLPPQKELPSIKCFNHAIVKVITKEGQTLWIDPTNFVSMARGIFPDIANRKALVLDTKSPSYDTIPDVDFKHAQVAFSKTIHLKDNITLSAKGRLNFYGEQALALTGAALIHSPQAIEEIVIQKICGEKSPIKRKLILPDLSSRVVKDTFIDYDYEQEYITLLTNIGIGIPLDNGWEELFLNTSEQQQNTMFLGPPTTMKYHVTLDNVHASKLRDLAYKIKTPWLNASRTLTQKKRGIDVVEHVEILRSFISPTEIKSSAFKDLQSKIKKYCRNVAIIVGKKH